MGIENETNEGKSDDVTLPQIGALERAVARLDRETEMFAHNNDYNAEFPAGDARSLREVLQGIKADLSGFDDPQQTDAPRSNPLEASGRHSQKDEDAARWQRLQKNPFAAMDALKAKCDASENGRVWGVQANEALDEVRQQWGDIGAQTISHPKWGRQSPDKSPAVAAIEFAMATDEGMEFLNCWLHGDFDAIRKEWPDCPQAVFDGAEVEPREQAIGVSAGPGM